MGHHNPQSLPTTPPPSVHYEDKTTEEICFYLRLKLDKWFTELVNHLSIGLMMLCGGSQDTVSNYPTPQDTPSPDVDCGDTWESGGWGQYGQLRLSTVIHAFDDPQSHVFTVELKHMLRVRASFSDSSVFSHRYSVNVAPWPLNVTAFANCLNKNHACPEIGFASEGENKNL